MSSSASCQVYLRTASKRASMVSLPEVVSFADLQLLASKQTRIQPENLILFYKGQQLDHSSIITPQSKTIVHCLNKSSVGSQKIHIQVKVIDDSNRRQSFSIEAGQKVGDFIKGPFFSQIGLNEHQVTLVYVGKHLASQNSFQDELVEDNSEIICLLNNSTLSKQVMQMGCQQSIPDPLFDLIMDNDLKENRWPHIIDEHKKNTEHQSLMAKNMNKQLFEKLKDHKTKNGWTISRAINTGTLYPDSFIGCHAGDLESYNDFKEFFYPVIEGCHFGFKMDGSMKHTTDIDSSKIQTKLTESTINKVISTRIRCARNLSMFPLNTVGTKETRIQVVELMEKVVKELPQDLAGELLRLDTMTEEKRQELIDAHYLFRGGDKMQAASGYHAYWPFGRGIFLSNDKKFMMWINQGDHLRIISMETGGNIQSVFDRFSKAVRIIEATIKKIANTETAFLSDPIIGMIACCPSNLGTCMRGSVHILLPKLIQKIGFKEIDKIARTMGCQARGSTGEHSKVIDRIDISNWRRLGFTEYRLVEDMMKCANELAKMEDQA